MTATTTDRGSADFALHTEPFRRELLAHCYRMLGSVHDAEDLVQETYLRAWRSYDRFEERSSVRTWLYRIATNACLNALRQDGRRVLPSGLASDIPDPKWLQPIPDALVSPESSDPAAIVATRESLRLALIASLQYLPPRQRAVLLLREVLAWPAAEVADLLGTSTAAVKSALQRARARLDEVSPAVDRIAEPDGPESRALLKRYIAAFEAADVAALERLLHEDATLEVVPGREWAAGRQGCLRIIRSVLGGPGDWRMTQTLANGQPAAVAHRHDADGVLRPFGVAVLATNVTHLTGIVVFADPALVAAFSRP
jgi:RNA polymerase sigma-70 factor (ECF subfamily)